jgi:TRAP-type uncharacterized transport system substrate-binding protein
MKKILILAVAAMLSSVAFAAADPDAPAAGGCSDSALSIGTGKAKKGYSKLYANIAKVCGTEVEICEVQTDGGLDNVNGMSTKDMKAGFAQLDTAKLMASDENIAALQYVMPLNTNYMHVVSLNSGFNTAGAKKWGGLKDGDPVLVKITNFSQLRGQTIAAVGSASAMARQLNAQLGYGMIVKDAPSDAKAFDMLRKVEVAAVFTLAGWPHGELKDLKQESNLTLVAFDAAANAPYTVRPLNYKGLGVYNVNTLGVQNVFFTRPFKGESAGQVAALRACIAKNLTKLQEGAFEPGWNEIKNIDAQVDWPNRFQGTASKKK